MGTRCVVEVADSDYTFFIYKHWDGYPENMRACFERTLPRAWPLPRFEADEWAAAFVAANKDDPGDIRLVPGANVPADVAYWYVVEAWNGQLNINAYETDGKKKGKRVETFTFNKE